MNGSSNPLLDKEEHVLKLGESFEKRPKSSFHTIRYDFKPASIDTSCEGELQVGKGDEVTITLPHIPGSTPPMTVFKGNKRPYQKDCVLIINHDTGEFVLEKLGSSIQVKKTRAEGSSKIQARIEQQSVRATQPPLQFRAPTKPGAGAKTSPSKDNPSPEPHLDDIKRELRAEVEVIEQMSSSSGSSSSSDSGSSSGSEDDSSSSEEEEEAHPSPTQHQQYSSRNPASNGTSQPQGSNQIMSTLRIGLDKLLERTRARRENLQKKMADRPTAAARPVAKRTREPLAETNKQPLQPAEEVQPSTKPSPSKKRCSDNKEVPAFGVENRLPLSPDPLPEPSETARKPPEAPVSSVSTIDKGDNGVKCTSPASTSVKSRLQKLAEQRRYLDNDDPTLESAHLSPVRSQKKVPSPPRQTAIAASSETPVGRKGRLANLAAAIGSWEDDLSHPSVKRNNAQEQPGTACLSKQSTTNGASACASSSNVKPHTTSYFQKTTEASVNKPIISAQQKLLERTRARRENLQKKMADRPTAAARPVAKRTREPLAETNKQPLQPAEEVQPSTKPSPSKKRCSDNKEVPAFGVENRLPLSPDPLPEPSETARKPPEAPVSSVSTIDKGDNGVKCTSPASTSVKSRLQKLAEQRRYLDNDDPTLESAHLSPVRSQKKVPSPPRQTAIAASSETPVGRKGRLANLAAAIGSWEDDLSHPSVKRNNAQEQPGTACLSKQSTTNGASACASSSNVKPHTTSYFQKTTEASVNKPIISAQQGSVLSPVKSTRDFPPSPQKTEIPKLQSQSGRRIPSSPQKTEISKPLATLQSEQSIAHSPQKNEAPKAQSPFQSGRVLSPSPKKTTEVQALQATKVASTRLQTREQLTKETHVQQQEKDTSSTPGGTGIKSFLERFGERCQERTTQSPPSSTLGQRTTTVTPNTKRVQERLLKAKQLTTTTADLTQKKRQDASETQEVPYSEPQQIKSLSAKGNESEGSYLKSSESSSSGIASILKGTKLAASPIKSTSPLIKVTFSEEIKSTELLSRTDGKQDKDEVVREIELNVDEEEINSSRVIDDLFDGVLEEEQEQSKKSPKRETQLFEEEEEEEEEDDNDKLNISSMSLLTPLAETVNAVVTSPEISTPTSTALEFSELPDTNRPIRFQRARVPHAESADNIELAGDEHNLLYSIDAYRSLRFKETERPQVKQVIVRKENVYQKLEENRNTGQVTIKQKMKILNDEINMQQTVIHQASQALNCCTDVEHGKGSQVEAEAERLLLVATERRVALLAEMNKLKNAGPSGQQASSTVKAQDSSASKGSVALSEIRLPLKADFICSAANKPDAANYYFFIMIRAGAENTVATPLSSTQNALCGDALSFPTKFTLPDVSSDFEIDMEVYSLVQRQDIPADKRKKGNKSKVVSLKLMVVVKAFVSIIVVFLASPGGPNAVRTSHFVLVGSHKLTLSSVGKNKFPLDKVPFMSPLEGHIYLKLQCQVGSSVEERGFLNPIGRINLSNCTSRKIDPANREFCARPNTFELITVRPQREDDSETLVSQCKNTMWVTKNWLSADTKEERNLWMQKLNQVLIDLRMWQPDACKLITKAQDYLCY
ncbi:Actin-binding protein anillin [Acipenser ruthenus]|uniref:Actin-binding protein anillin n=1 Tax=Acipenser ruthenus TaxID=7906 RepID=A0A662YYW7_ACIRT|nr:Actin-binding protein anillin [Acipenser ruthenus]